MATHESYRVSCRRKSQRRGLPVFAIHFAVVMTVLAAPLLAGAQWEVPDKTRPAYEVYENLKLFHDDRVSVEWLERTMNNLNRYLGVECTHCHEQDNWAKGDLSNEQVHAREMIPKMWDLSGWANTDLFNPEGLDGPACWTCHRGSTKPETIPPNPRQVNVPDPSPFIDSQEPSEKVYRNIQQLNKLPARNLPAVMKMMSVALGVECSHCHVEGDYASDEKKPKQVALKMFRFRTAILKKYFDSRFDAIYCWTCHRGATQPEIRPAN